MMKLDKDKGILMNARQVASPNCNDRPLGVEVDLIVIHNISLPPKEFGGPYIDAFFTNTLEHTRHPFFAEIADLQVSSHCLIRRNGEIVQYVPFHKRAWHAGESSFNNRDNCNDYSIGIELEGADDIPYKKIQYEVLANLIRVLQYHYPKITKDRIVGHSTIAPFRKTDPGDFFDWLLLASLLSMDLTTLQV